MKAFTLIELISVIMIVAILITLLVPAAGKVREGGRSAKCMGNLRNIGVAFQAYSAENDNLLPAARFVGSRPVENRPHQNPTERNWQEEIQPYFQEGMTFADARNLNKTVNRFIYCPTYFAEYMRDRELWNLQASGYGMNNSLARFMLNGRMVTSWDYRFSKLLIENPAMTILAGDSDDYFLQVNKSLVPNEAKRGYFHGYSDMCGDPVRHLKKANYLFVDGHLASLSQEEAAAVFEEQSIW